MILHDKLIPLPFDIVGGLLFMMSTKVSVRYGSDCLFRMLHKNVEFFIRYGVIVRYEMLYELFSIMINIISRLNCMYLALYFLKYLSVLGILLQINVDRWMSSNGIHVPWVEGKILDVN